MNKHFQSVLNLAQAGHHAEALKKCDRFIKKTPKDVNFLLLAASIYAQIEQYDKVKDLCLRVVRLNPKDTNALYNLAVASLYLKDYNNAILYLEKLIKLEPKHIGGNVNLSVAYWNVRNLEKAKEFGLKAEKIDANHAFNINNLGLIYKDLDEKNKAISYFKKAITLNPQLSEAYYNCGITLSALNEDSDEANEYIDKSLAINPNYPEAANHVALRLLEDDKITEAIALFKVAITNKTDYAEAYCNLGNAFMCDNAYTNAESMYRKAIEYKPGFANAYNNLGNALLEQDDYRENYEEAEACYLKAIELAPELDDTYKNLAICYQGEGIQDKSLHYFNLYNERVPNDEVVIAGMASVHERCGEYDAGLALIKPFLDNADVSAEIIMALAKLSKHFNLQDKAIAALINIDDDNITDKLKIEKYYALGKLSEPKGDADTTITYYKLANDLEDESFDIFLEKRKFDNIKAYYTRENIQNLKRATNESRLPIFIVGMPRSGTSLAEQVLASHPDVFGAGELEDIHNIVLRMSGELTPKNDYPLCMSSMTTDYANLVSGDHIEKLQSMSPKAKYIVDKMPHNFMGLGMINLLFPNATVVQCKRNSVDTCLSIYFQHFNQHHSYSNSLKKLGEYYNLYADMMEHWKKTLDINFVELEYEKVIANPEQEMRCLLEKCGIEWDPVCLKFHENKRTVMTPSYDQVRQPIYTSSVAKWKKYEHHLSDLIDSLGSRTY